MNIKDLKIGKKLYGGYIAVLILTLLVGFIAYRGISKITYQIEISKIVNRIIVDAGDAQASSLRYILFGDEKYYEGVNTEADEIFRQSEEVKKLLLSLDNKKIVDDIESYITVYSEDNVEYHKLSIDKTEVHAKRAAAALATTNQIIQVIDEAKAISRAQKNNYDAVEIVYMMQDARNAMNRVRINDNKYVNDPNAETERILMSEIDRIKRLLEKDEELISNKKMKSEVHEALLMLDSYRNEFIKYKTIIEQENALLADMKKNAAGLLKDARGLRAGVYEYVDQTQASSYILLIITIIGALGLGLAIGGFITRGITVPLSTSVKFANDISNGDLTQSIDIEQKDEIGMLGVALKNMSEKLKEVVSTIVSSSGNISSASQQLSASSQQIASGVNQQAASSEEVSSSMEEMTANIQQNTDNALKTRQISTKASNAMEQVAMASEDSMNAVKDIFSKINVVVEIAEKTDLLAINAAVEAARAGDQGRGFAVVAAEVRKLAERSQNAASEIVELAERGMKMTEESTHMLKDIVPDIQETSRLVEEIASSSQEQDSGANQVNVAIQQLTMVTQHNASAAEEMAGGSEEMAAQANELEDITNHFKIEKRARRSKKMTTRVNTSAPEPVYPVSKPGNSQPKEMKSEYDIDLSSLSSDIDDFENM